VGEAEGVADEEGAVAVRGVEVHRVVQEVRVALQVIELALCLARHVPGGAEVIVRRAPGAAGLGRVERAAPDVEPVRLGDVPAVAADVI
jgi:hypothetical protein